MDFEKLNLKQIRTGKTRRDHRSGAWSHRFANQEARAAWSNGVEKDFPVHSCNGRSYYRGGHDSTAERLKRAAL